MFPDGADFTKLKTVWNTNKYSELLQILKNGTGAMTTMEIQACFSKCTENLNKKKKEGNK